MYYEEKMINGVLMCRYKPDGEWRQCEVTAMSSRIKYQQDEIVRLRTLIDGWQSIDSAPMHTEILAFRDDAGVFVAQFTALATFLTEGEIENGPFSEEELHENCWWYGDTHGADRLEGDLIPTHWMPFPESPVSEKPQ